MTIPVDFSSNAAAITPPVRNLAGAVDRAGDAAAKAGGRFGDMAKSMASSGGALGGLAGKFGLIGAAIAASINLVMKLEERLNALPNAMQELRTKMGDAVEVGKKTEAGDRKAAIEGIGAQAKAAGLTSDQLVQAARLGVSESSLVETAATQQSLSDADRDRMNRIVEMVRAKGGSPEAAVQTISEKLKNTGGIFGKQSYSDEQLFAAGMGGAMEPDMAKRRQAILAGGTGSLENTVRQAGDLASYKAHEYDPRFAESLRTIQLATDQESRKAYEKEERERVEAKNDPVGTEMRKVAASMEKAAAAIEERASRESDLAAAIKELTSAITGGEGSFRGQAGRARVVSDAARYGGVR